MIRSSIELKKRPAFCIAVGKYVESAHLLIPSRISMVYLHLAVDF